MTKNGDTESTHTVLQPTVSPQARTLTEEFSSSHSMVSYSLKGTERNEIQANLRKEKDAPPHPQIST